MALVFQYGSNTSSARINGHDRLRGDARSLGSAYTEGTFEFDFNVWSGGKNNCWVSDIREGGGQTIWGVVYDIPDYLIHRATAKDQGRKSLDAIEGEGKNYRRRPIAVRWPDGKPVPPPVITYTVIDRSRPVRLHFHM